MQGFPTFIRLTDTDALKILIVSVLEFVLTLLKGLPRHKQIFLTNLRLNINLFTAVSSFRLLPDDPSETYLNF